MKIKSLNEIIFVNILESHTLCVLRFICSETGFKGATIGIHGKKSYFIVHPSVDLIAHSTAESNFEMVRRSGTSVNSPAKKM